MVPYMCPVSLWWGGERRDVEEVRTGEWSKISGKEEHDASNADILFKGKHITECSSDKSCICVLYYVTVVPQCFCMSNSGVSAEMRCYRNVTNQHAKFMLSLPVPRNKMTRKQGLCWNKWKMVWTARSKHAMTALIWDRWNTHCVHDGSGQCFTTLCNREITLHSSVGLGSHNLYVGSYGNVSNAENSQRWNDSHTAGVASSEAAWRLPTCSCCS